MRGISIAKRAFWIENLVQGERRLHKGSVQSLLLEVRKKRDEDNAPGTWCYPDFRQEDKAVSLVLDSLI